jgi:hypothetical protein
MGKRHRRRLASEARRSRGRHRRGPARGRSRSLRAPSRSGRRISATRRHVPAWSRPVSPSSGGATCSATAGVYMSHHVADVTVEQYRRIMAVNVGAYFFLLAGCHPAPPRGGGSIVFFIASERRAQGIPYSVPYCEQGRRGAAHRAGGGFLKTPLSVGAIARRARTPASGRACGGPPARTPTSSAASEASGTVGARKVAALFAYLASDRSARSPAVYVDNGPDHRS